MATNTLIINTADLRSFTDIGNNYNTRDLANAVLKAQDIELERKIGKALFDRIAGDIASSTAFTGVYLTLVNDYIKPYLIQESYLNILETQYLTPSSRGIGQRSAAPGFTPATREIYHEKRRSIKEDIDFRANRLIEFLDYNRSSFPELSESVDLPSEQPNLDPQFTRSPLIINREKYGN